MEKNYDGFYSLACVNTFNWARNHYPDDVDSKAEYYLAEYYLQVSGGKISDCVCWDYEPWRGESVFEWEKNAVGEDIKNFFIEKFMETDVEHHIAWMVDKIDQKEFINGKDSIFAELGIFLEQEHNKLIADVLQAKANKNALGKTEVMNRIAGMKGGYSGEDAMEKNYDGYYSVGYTSVDAGIDGARCYLQVSDGKISDCVYWDAEHRKNKSTTKQEEDAIGKDVKDFFVEKFIETDLYRIWNADKIDSLEFIEQKNRIFDRFGISEEEHNQRVADILQAKENKNTLGKADTLSRIAGIKNERTGGK